MFVVDLNKFLRLDVEYQIIAARKQDSNSLKFKSKDGPGAEWGKPTLTLNCQRTLFPPVEENQ